MNATHSTLNHVAKQLVAQGKGLIAADERHKTLHVRFETRGIPQTEEMRRAYRELLFSVRGIEKRLSGVILHEETLRQTDATGILFPNLLRVRGIAVGVKVDKGTVPLPNFTGEKVTEGLDGLKQRLEEYKGLGAVFTKWRAVFSVGKETPSVPCIEGNALGLALFAALSQEAGLVPIPEPEVLMDGDHDMQSCERATGRVLQTVFAAFTKYRVDLSGLLLKVNMVLPGKEAKKRPAPELVALSTVRVLKAAVPKEVPGIFFLSGGQTPREATQNLNAIVLAGRKTKAPWELSFSFARALQDDAMDAWAGKEENVKKAQEIFAKRVEETAAAARGELENH